MKVMEESRHWVSVVARRSILLVGVTLIASGCDGGGSLMTRAERISDPPQGKALVTFVRPSGVRGYAFEIWDGTSLVGVLNWGTCIQYEATPGAHYFLARSENWSCVKADLAAGKQYVIKTNPFFGVLRVRVAFDPVTATDYGTQLKDVKKWLAQLEPVAPDPQRAQAYSEPRRAEVLAEQATFESGRGRYEVLTAQDCLPQ